ncbi:MULTISPECIES: efflux RND transporter periplasmic adaptor subunit [Cyanophyceae]|uniref:efflux RND transporter periplasmic adaptor subunit n=1 Tax=Cyanophyceae TaxID=3028117 RepID=UPI001689334B|nr:MULTISPECIES: efflux RND transporter periplasmic adaptor subunit [unclassified Phormidium]MBD1915171.1 ABC exporter membrane fusion protein [Phormidium sp. FACHB-77]MBD2028441.1 ABC exporter membrane fusion protein [Phormidium sp. FACHB-322]MBD2051853.1 ABC exporter membrane fusion protein [Leptolyngbya sp. FACHB-60]
MKPNYVSSDKPILKPSARWLVFGALAAALAVSGVTWQYVSRFRQSGGAVTDAAASSVARTGVSALGHLQPEGEVINLSPPLLPNGTGSRVEHIVVEEGEWVEAGETVAILDSYESFQAAVKQAEQRVEVARASLAQVQAGAKIGELEAQSATITQLQADRQGQLNAQDQRLARLKAELTNAQTEHARYQNLFQAGAIAASELDSKQLTLTAAQEQWQEAQVQRHRLETTFQEQIKGAEATLNQIAEVRPTDVQAAQAELQSAIADVEKAKADLNLTTIRAPTAGQILKIHARPGEVVGPQGIAALGQTQQMMVLAEVYELDVSYVQVGQTATITADALPGTLQGEVAQVGFQINSQNVLSTDPVADVDQRVVEVKIRLGPADSQRVAALTNLQVNVVIATRSALN